MIVSVRTLIAPSDLLEVAHGDAESVSTIGGIIREMAFLWTSLDLLLTPPILSVGSISVASHLKKKSQTSFLCTAFVTVHTCVHHMHVKSFEFPVQLKNFGMCTTITATVPNVKQNLGLFRPLLNWSHTNCFVHVKHVGFPCMLVFQGLLSNGMYLYNIFNL